MDDSTFAPLINELRQAPGLVVGLILILSAIAVFSPYARAKIHYRLARLGWVTLGVGTVVLCAWGYLVS
ncbi:hypothetical protein LO763_11615 [Glycomyces sp. A-F 0318]|uniref:hypothetical protein n=1 Tax=Glycomyces amatae TaxID=2881355 RepID=UPI001E289CF5|nr:hypothetical protein [Glycomyces amatae]MCD0444269.1 hypothetical protein [Glycomyces amatae]